MGEDLSNLLEEWEQLLLGTQTYLRVQASTALSYSAVARIERNAYRQSQALLVQLGVLEGGTDLRQATDELLNEAAEPAMAAPDDALVQDDSLVMDDGPEGVADDANREVSEEATSEAGEAVLAVADVEPSDVGASAEEDEAESFDLFDLDEPDTSYDRAAGDDDDVPDVLEPEDDGALDLESDTESEAEELELDELEELELDDDLLDEEPTGEVVRPGSPDLSAGPVLADFDFDDDDQDETVVFALGTKALDDLIAEDEIDSDLIEADSGDQPAFDLVLDVDDDDEIELEDVEDDASDAEAISEGPASASVGVAGVRVGGGSGDSGVTAGLYGNPNVPTIRETREAPRAAAIQISAAAAAAAKGPQSGSGGAFDEDEEVLEIGSAEDYGEDEGGSASGFSLSVQEYEDEEEEWEESVDEPEEEAPPEPVFTGPTPEQVAAVLEDAYIAAQNGDMQRGIDLFGDVIDVEGGHSGAHVGRGRLYLDLGEYTRAMSDFMVAEEAAPDSPEPQVAIGDLYFARKDYRKAIDYFNEALRLEPDHAMAHCRRGISFYYRKKYSDALTDLKQAEKLDPEIPNIGTYIGMAKKKAKRG